MRRKSPNSLRLTALVLMCLGAAPAGATITCSLSAPSMEIVYSLGMTSSTAGTINLNCTRATNDPNSVSYWVSLDNGETGTRRLFRHGGGTGTSDRITYDIRQGSSILSWTASGLGRVSGTQSFGGSTTVTIPLPYTFRISAQTGKAAGIYDSLVTASLQLSSAGAVVASTNFYVTASVPTQCFVGQVASGNAAPGAISPGALTLDYTSFEPVARTATMGFTVNCTMNTAYALALSPTSGTLLGLNYTLSLDASSATGTGLAQNFTVTGTVPDNQSGICTTSASVCTGTQVTTITITY